MDKEYFLRRNYQPGPGTECSIYDINPDYRTTRDPLVRSFLARKRYWQFVREMNKDLEIYNTSLSFTH